MNLLDARNIEVTFPTPDGPLTAVRNVSFSLGEGETLGLVGESGCGKSTLAKAIMRLIPVTRGELLVQGQDIAPLSQRQLRPLRPLLQMVFQDPNGSLNPRHNVGKIIGQPLSVAGRPREEIRARVLEMLAQIGLPPAAMHRFPHEFSGGQRQRIAIARALVLCPRLLICDEPVSALDVSVRAQIINLLKNLQGRLGISYLFVSHDLSVVRHVCDRVLVMYLGRIVESGDTEAVWSRPAHPYTLALLRSAPVAHPRLRRKQPPLLKDGELPSPLNPPPGCPFSTRCPHAQARCHQEIPMLRPVTDRQSVACHFDLLGPALRPAS